MNQFEINTNYYNQEISSYRKREWLLILFVLIFFGLYSFYTKQDPILTITICIILLILFPLKINAGYNKYSFCYKVIFSENKIVFYFLHPFYRKNIIKEYNVSDLNLDLINNNNLCTISFSTKSDIYIKTLFEIKTHINGWKTEQLLEIEKLFKHCL